MKCTLCSLLVLALALAAAAQDTVAGGGAATGGVPAAGVTTAATTTPVDSPSTTPTPTTPVVPSTTPTPTLAPATTPTTPIDSPTTPATTPVVAPTTPLIATPTPSAPTTPVSLPSTGSSSSQSRSNSASVVIVSIISTLPNGQVSTGVSMSTQPAPTSANDNSTHEKSNGKTWGIVGGVVGGIAAFALAAFLIFRCTQRRFSELDDDDVAIKWPELVNRGEDATTLNPLAARQGSGHGVGDDGDEEKAFMAGGYNDSQTNFAPSRSGTISQSSPSPGPYTPYGGVGDPQAQQPYYDPYLGSAGPPPGMYGAAPYADFANYSAAAPVEGNNALTSSGSQSAGHAAVPLDRRVSTASSDGYRQSWTAGGEAIAMSKVGQSQQSSSEQYWRHRQDEGAVETVAPTTRGF